MKTLITKISVILPVYNVEKYIEKCIQSLLDQTLKDVEFIFVDDCSPDNSVEIIKRYNDPRIKLIRHNVNKYTAEARNTGVKAATGEYIAFLDPDDYIENNFLERLYDLAKKNNADIAKGLIRYIPSNRIINKNNLIQINKFNFISTPWSAIYKRKLFSKPYVKFYVDTMVGQFLLVYYANKVVTCEDAIYNYVMHEGSCINTEFSPEKWRKLNVRGAELVLHFMNRLDLSQFDYCLILRKLLLGLYQYGYNKMSDDNKALCKNELKMYLTDLLIKAKYTNKKFLAQYEEVLKKYA